MFKNKIIIFIVIIILFSSLLRLWKIGNQSLWIDEGFTINASMAIVDKGFPILDSEKIYRTGFLYNYISAGLIKITDFNPFNPWQVRLPSVLFGLLSILAVFFLSLKLFNKNVAILSSFILSFSTWHIAWSRQARGYTAAQFFILLSFYFLWSFLEKKKNKFIVFSLISFIFASLSHQISIVFLPAFILIILFYPKKRFSLKEWSIIIALFSLTTIFLLNVISFPKIEIYNFSSYYFKFIKTEFLNILIVSSIAIIFSILTKKRYLAFSLLLISIIPFLIISHFIYMIHYRYLFPIFPFLIILFSLGISLFFEFFQRITKLKSSLFVIIPSLILSLYLIFPILNFIPKENYILEYGSPQPNFKEAYMVIKERKKENQIIISPYTPLSKIYLNDIGYWLPTSLSGKEDEIKDRTIDEKDYYSGSPIIPDDNSLVEIIESESGFIVIDQMAKNRLGKRFNIIDKSEKTEIIYESKSPRLGNIWVYMF